MNIKSFEYRNKDINLLKKDNTIRTIFVVLFGAVAIWQIVLLALAVLNDTLNVGNLISCCVVFFVSFVFVLVSILRITKNARTINVIKAKGKCVNSVNVMFDTSKTGFMTMYSVLTKVVAVLCLVILVCSLTSLLLQIKFFETVSFYLPLLVVFCLSGLYSSHHVDEEIATVKTVDEFNKIY